MYSLYYKVSQVFDEFGISHIHQYTIIQNTLTALISCALAIQSSSPSHKLFTTDRFASTMTVPSPECHVIGVISV